MDKQSIQEMEQLLLTKRQEVVKELDNIGHRAEGSETNFNADYPDYGDNIAPEDSANEVADYTTNLSLERDLENELKDIDKALHRIKEGKYGICTHCGEEIEIERLKIRPESTSCVKCKNTLKGSV